MAEVCNLLHNFRLEHLEASSKFCMTAIYSFVLLCSYGLEKGPKYILNNCLPT